MKENGTNKQKREMEKDIRPGLMVHSMKDIGKMIRLMVEAD